MVIGKVLEFFEKELGYGRYDRLEKFAAIWQKYMKVSVLDTSTKDEDPNSAKNLIAKMSKEELRKFYIDLENI